MHTYVLYLFLGCENIQSSSLEITNVITTLMSYSKTDADGVEIVDPNYLHSTVKIMFYYILCILAKF